ncbi:MAG: hypothetical protein ACK56F_17420 [bacterium]
MGWCAKMVVMHHINSRANKISDIISRAKTQPLPVQLESTELMVKRRHGSQSTSPRP